MILLGAVNCFLPFLLCLLGGTAFFSTRVFTVKGTFPLEVLGAVDKAACVLILTALST